MASPCSQGKFKHSDHDRVLCSETYLLKVEAMTLFGDDDLDVPRIERGICRVHREIRRIEPRLLSPGHYRRIGPHTRCPSTLFARRTIRNHGM